MTAYAASAAAPPRVAVFSQSDFPFYNAASNVSPMAVAADLRKAGVAADVLDAAALADPATLNARRYAVVVLPYGNTYPLEAFANLKTFHQAGGGFILSGVPFTHGVARGKDAGGHETWNDQGHNSAAALFGPDGIGVGGFIDEPGNNVTIAPGDPLGLEHISHDWAGGGQALDVRSLPAEDRVIPVLTASAGPIAAVIVHKDAQYPGAVDVWTQHPNKYGSDGTDNEQFLSRAAIVALGTKGELTPEQQMAALEKLDKLPKPKVYADLTLPDVPRPYPTFQPRGNPMAEHLYVADVRQMTPDEKVLLNSLQGIVNRKQPRIYLIFRDSDPFWLDQMQKQGQTGEPVTVSDPWSLVKTFRTEIRGAVVPDPKVFVSPQVAVDIAGLDDEVIATPELADRLGLPVKTDLRGRFKDDADAYRYVRTKLLRRLNPYLSISLGPVDAGALDQIIAARGMAFWITGPREQSKPGANERAEIEEIKATFARLPLNAVVRGYWYTGGDGNGIDEGPGVSLASTFGKVTIVTDLVSNFSVFAGARNTADLHQQFAPPPALDPTKVYVAITVSDGDNLCTWQSNFQDYFLDPLHGTFPVGWGMGPTLIDVAPSLAQWYYSHATPNDEFLCDVSGVGYIYPPDWAKALKDRDGALKAFYGWTQQYMDRLDMKTIRLMNVQAEDIAKVGTLMPKTAFLMPDYGYAGEKPYDAITYTLPTGQPVFRAITNTGADGMAEQIRDRVGTARPAFVNAFIMNWGMKLSDLKAMLDSLGPEYVAVTPSQLNALYKEAKDK
jgi:hypothetical protein